MAILLPPFCHQQGDLVLVDADHGLAQIGGQLSQLLGVVVVGDGLDNGGGTLGGVAGLEDTGANEHALGAQVHHQGRVSGGGHAAGGEVDHGQTAVLLDIAQQLHGNL